MAKVLFLLKEEINQENFKTKVKHIYTSEINRNIVTLLESKYRDFVYLSHNYGVLLPDDEIEPYKVKPLTNRNIWSLLTAEYVNRYCREKEYNEICLMYSGEFYQSLENNLKKYGYAIDQPMKNFRTNELKLRWLYSELQKNVCGRLLK